MLRFQNILFPVDLSAQCRETAPYVQAVAQRFGADITMLHVIEIPPYWYGAMGAESFAAMVDLPQITGARGKEFEHFLESELAGTRVERLLEQGDPVSIVKEVALHRGVDLIMMPTHGSGPFRQLLLGSVTAKVLHDLGCPVWTAAHAERQVKHPGDIRSILCAMELGPEGAPLLDWAAKLAQSYQAKLRIVHAVPGADGPPNQYFNTELDAFLMNMARQEFAKLQAKLHTQFDVCIGRGDVAKVVRETAMHHDADMVVMGRGHIQKVLGRFRTHAYSVIRETPCPVLSVAA